MSVAAAGLDLSGSRPGVSLAGSTLPLPVPPGPTSTTALQGDAVAAEAHKCVDVEDLLKHPEGPENTRALTALAQKLVTGLLAPVLGADTAHNTPYFNTPPTIHRVLTRVPRGDGWEEAAKLRRQLEQLQCSQATVARRLERLEAELKKCTYENKELCSQLARLARQAVHNSFTAWVSCKELWTDKRVVEAAVVESGTCLQHASDPLRADREVVLAAVAQDGLALEYSLTEDREIVLTAVAQNGDALGYVSGQLQSDRQVVLAAVGQDGLALGYVPELCEDQEVVLAAVSQNGLALKYASEDMQSDKEVTLAAVKQRGTALYYTSEEVRSERQLVLAAVRQNGRALLHAPQELCEDREVVLAAVTQYGLALKYALIEDREIVLTAVAQNGDALGYAEQLQSDRQVVLAAVGQDGLALGYASDELQSDPQVALTAVTQAGDALQYASEDICDERTVVMAAVAQRGSALKYASAQLKADHEVVQAAVTKYGRTLRYAAPQLQADPVVVLAAVAQDSSAIAYASDQMQRSVPLLRKFRPLQRMLLTAMIECRGADCFADAPLVPGLQLSTDVRQLVGAHLAASTTLPGSAWPDCDCAGCASSVSPFPFAWHEAQVPLSHSDSYDSEMDGYDTEAYDSDSMPDDY
jgi:hypothetical protein